MKRAWLALMMLALGCADTRLVHHQPTQDDPPFGGGFESSRYPSRQDDPLDPNLRRSEIRMQWRGDKGAPETRIDRRTQ